MTADELAREGRRLLFEKRFPPVQVTTSSEELDAGSPEWNERHLHDRYKHNRMRYACSLHAILPSRGCDKCVFGPRCDVANDPELRWLCRVGDPCPVEAERYKAYVEATRWQFRRALNWIDDATYDALIRDLALYDLQNVRISARARDEGHVREVRRERPDGNFEQCLAPTLSERYSTAVHRPFMRIWNRLLHDPRSDGEKEPVCDCLRVQELMERVQRALHEQGESDEAQPTLS